MAFSNLTYKRVKLTFLDTHTTTGNLLAPGLINDNYNFLSDPALYRQQFLSGKTAGSVLSPLSKWAFKKRTYRQNGAPATRARHIFWNRYKDSFIAGKNPDFWKLQMPFLYAPEPKVKVDVKKLSSCDARTIGCNLVLHTYVHDVSAAKEFPGHISSRNRPGIGGVS